MKESDLYVPVKNYLEKLGYNVYAEVEVNRYGSRRADVVGRNAPATCIVEMKTSLSMELIDQAFKWLAYSHYIYIAIPERKKSVPDFVVKILKEFGIGLLQITRWGDARVYVRAKFNRPHIKVDWENVLRPEHQTWVEGGTNGGGYVTEYKLTINKVKQFLQRKGDWVTISEILDHCETHYANPKNSLSKALRDFEHDWCEVKKDRRLYFRAKKGVF